jgi:CheY-like chemotaxis protein
MDKKQLKVLLIEDQQKNATEIKNGLIALGFDVAVSGSVDRGLCAQKLPFRYVRCELCEDGKDGFNFVLALKKETDYTNNQFFFTINPKVKVDIRYENLLSLLIFSRLPCDVNELAIRVDKVMNQHPQAADKPEKGKSTEESQRKVGGKVLLVEDNPLNQKVLECLLRSLDLNTI